MPRNVRTFTDLDLSFTANPVTKDISVLIDENAIKRSVKQLILTNYYERLFHPEIGGQVTALLFENFTPLTVSTLERSISNTIRNFEPRVDLLGVDINAAPDNNSLYVSINFKIKNTFRPITLDLTLDRTR